MHMSSVINNSRTKNARIRSEHNVLPVITDTDKNTSPQHVQWYIMDRGFLTKRSIIMVIYMSSYFPISKDFSNLTLIRLYLKSAQNQRKNCLNWSKNIFHFLFFKIFFLSAYCCINSCDAFKYHANQIFWVMAWTDYKNAKIIKKKWLKSAKKDFFHFFLFAHCCITLHDTTKNVQIGSTGFGFCPGQTIRLLKINEKMA